jgi:hypothetical protein
MNTWAKEEVRRIADVELVSGCRGQVLRASLSRKSAFSAENHGLVLSVNCTCSQTHESMAA